MMHGATRIGDMIIAGGHHDPSSPLLEFPRHFRNACAHGGRWHFRQGEPRRDAQVRGFVVTANLHGHRAPWITVEPRLYVEFLEDIAEYFAPEVAALDPLKGVVAAPSLGDGVPTAGAVLGPSSRRERPPES